MIIPPKCCEEYLLTTTVKTSKAGTLTALFKCDKCGKIQRRYVNRHHSSWVIPKLIVLNDYDGMKEAIVYKHKKGSKTGKLVYGVVAFIKGNPILMRMKLVDI